VATVKRGLKLCGELRGIAPWDSNPQNASGAVEVENFRSRPFSVFGDTEDGAALIKELSSLTGKIVTLQVHLTRKGTLICHGIDR